MNISCYNKRSSCVLSFFYVFSAVSSFNTNSYPLPKRVSPVKGTAYILSHGMTLALKQNFRSNTFSFTRVGDTRVKRNQFSGPFLGITFADIHVAIALKLEQTESRSVLLRFDGQRTWSIRVFDAFSQSCKRMVG